MAGPLMIIGYIAVLAFIVSSMLVMGLRVTVSDLFSPLKNKRLMVLTLLANFVVVPLLAFVIIYIFPLSAGMAAGLILVAIAAGAPSTPKVAEFTGGNIAYAVSMTVLMTVVTIVLMPVLLPLLVEGFGMDPTKVIVNLIVLILIPLVAGILVRNKLPKVADTGVRVMEWVSNISIALIFISFGIIFFANLTELFGGSTGTGAVVGAILFTVGALVVGYAMGGPGKDTRGVLAFGTGFRNVTAALVVITATYSDAANDVMLMVLMVTIFSVIIVSAIVGLILRKRIIAEKVGQGG